MRTPWVIAFLATLLALLINHIVQPPQDLKPKVFVIGLSKTGTTSIGDALALLGYKRLGWKDIRSRALVHSYAHADLASLVSQTHFYDAFEDLPWPAVYQEMATRYPSAKFLLSLRRNEYVWLRSMRRHMARGAWDGYAYFYGTPPGRVDGEGNGDALDDVLLAAYRNHTAQVRDFFREQPQRYAELVIDESGERNWEALCRVAKCAGGEKGKEFPRSNAAAAWEMGWVMKWLRWVWGYSITRIEELSVRWCYGREGPGLGKPVLGVAWVVLSMIEQACSEVYYRAMAVKP